MRLNAQFWVPWLLLCLATTLVVGPLSPFLGFNVIVYSVGWEPLERAGPYVVAILSASLSGTAAGLIGVVLLRRTVGRKTRRKEVVAVSGFLLASFLSMGTYLILTSGFILGLVVLCLGSLVLWILAMGILISLPFLYARESPMPSGTQST